jgi:hypothetical protein
MDRASQDQETAAGSICHRDCVPGRELGLGRASHQGVVWYRACVPLPADVAESPLLKEDPMDQSCFVKLLSVVHPRREKSVASFQATVDVE